MSSWQRLTSRLGGGGAVQLSELGSLRLRVYDGPKNHMMPVFRAAAALGLPTTSADDWSVLWCFRTPWEYDTTKLKLKLKSEGLGQPFVLNHMPGVGSLASKADLVSFAEQLSRRLPHVFRGLTPETFVLPEQRKELQARDNVEDARVLREAGDAASQLMRRISQVWARVHLAWRDAYRQSQERAAAAAAERSRQSLVNAGEMEGVN